MLVNDYNIYLIEFNFLLQVNSVLYKVDEMYILKVLQTKKPNTIKITGAKHEYRNIPFASAMSVSFVVNCFPSTFLSRSMLSSISSPSPQI